MKTIKLFALVGFFSTFLFSLPTAASSVEQLSDEAPNYVIIGAFKYHRNALRFTQHASRDLSLNAKYEMNTSRNLYYVYVLSTQSRDAAISEARRLREESEFKDTWVYYGSLGKQQRGSAITSVDINPVTGKAIAHVSSEPAAPEKIEHEVSIPETTITPHAAPNDATTTASTKTQLTLDDDMKGKSFVFRINKASDNSPVEGEVEVIDLDKARKMGTFKGNIPVRITQPTGASGDLSLVCEVFGYRKVQRTVDYVNPEAEDIKLDNEGAVEVPFELVRLQKGDIAVMYNVYFFKDAGIMRPESLYEVTSLMQMLLENPKYKIKIHGHTNGGASGKIVSMNENSTNYFSLTNTKDGFGSAKKLSDERASVIKKFLESKGIDPQRMEIKAWGGKRPIHDKHHTRAQENVRVEIEILEDK
jgi:outer membrane protein OmpA-like peptidoglycan-associated protein